MVSKRLLLAASGGMLMIAAPCRGGCSRDGAENGVYYVFHDGTLYRSADDGATFTPAATGLPAGDQVLLHSVPGRAGELWLALGSAGLYHSTDGGRHFGKVDTVRDAHLFALGRTGSFRSPDSGPSWQRINQAALRPRSNFER